jgi:hypothetical protein
MWQLEFYKAPDLSISLLAACYKVMETLVLPVRLSIREIPLEWIIYKKSMFKAYLTSATQIS